MKAFSKRNPSIFLGTYENLSLKCLEIWSFFPLNMANLGHSFHEVPLYQLKSYFSDQNLLKYSLVIFFFSLVRSRSCTLSEGPRLQTIFLKRSWFSERK